MLATMPALLRAFAMRSTNKVLTPCFFVVQAHHALILIAPIVHIPASVTHPSHLVQPRGLQGHCTQYSQIALSTFNFLRSWFVAVAKCPPPTLVKVRAGLRAGEVAGWACTIAITCSEFHKRREKSRRLGWIALTDGPVSMCVRACFACGRASGEWSLCGRTSATACS